MFRLDRKAAAKYLFDHCALCESTSRGVQLLTHGTSGITRTGLPPLAAKDSLIAGQRCGRVASGSHFLKIISTP